MKKYTMTLKTYENLTSVEVGDVVMVVYAGRPVGVAEKPTEKLTVTKVGRIRATLSNGYSVKLGADEFIGIAKYE